MFFDINYEYNITLNYNIYPLSLPGKLQIFHYLGSRKPFTTWEAANLSLPGKPPTFHYLGNCKPFITWEAAILMKLYTGLTHSSSLVSQIQS